MKMSVYLNFNFRKCSNFCKAKMQNIVCTDLGDLKVCCKDRTDSVSSNRSYFRRNFDFRITEVAYELTDKGILS